MNGSVALAGDLEMIDLRLVANHQLKHGIDLVVLVIGTFMGLDQGRAGPSADHHQ